MNDDALEAVVSVVVVVGIVAEIEIPSSSRNRDSTDSIDTQRDDLMKSMKRKHGQPSDRAQNHGQPSDRAQNHEPAASTECRRLGKVY